MPGASVTSQNLQSDFLPLSAQRPVVIIVWSPRSAESVELLRTFGKLEVEGNGAWVLAHVHAEEQVPVAQALQVQSIPFGVVLIGGQAVPFLEKAIGENEIREVLGKILQVAAQQGVGEAPVEESEPEEDEALAALDAGDYSTAEAAYRKLLARKPNDQYAVLGLAQVHLLIRTEGLDAAKIMEEAVSKPEDIAVQLQCADVEVMSGYLDSAFDRLLALITVLFGDERTQVKDRLLELFALVDPADPRVIKARAQLANALF